MRLRYRLAAVNCDRGPDVAQGYAENEDVVAGELLSEFLGLINHRPLYLVVLLPSVDSLISREANRDEVGYGSWSAPELHAAFADGTPRIGLWLDTTNQTPAETVDEILARRSEAALR